MKRTPPQAAKLTDSPRFEGFRGGIARAVMVADGVIWHGCDCGLDTFMLALREELPMEDDVSRLEPRVARIEADVSQLNARVANVEVDLRDLRTSMDHKLEVMDTKFDHRLEVLTATLAEGFKAMDARFERMDVRFERMDARMDARFEQMDARFEKMESKMDARFEQMDARLTEGMKAVDAKLDKMDGKLAEGLKAVDAKLEKLDTKFDGKFDILGKRRFTLLITLLSATATLVAAVLGVLLSGSHAH
jgi:phage shock protein A